jgi:hypothetical protein
MDDDVRLEDQRLPGLKWNDASRISGSPDADIGLGSANLSRFSANGQAA